jgi:hypothetical protein
MVVGAPKSTGPMVESAACSGEATTSRRPHRREERASGSSTPHDAPARKPRLHRQADRHLRPARGRRVRRNLPRLVGSIVELLSDWHARQPDPKPKSAADRPHR